jgi:hypothetical protein
MACSAHGEMRNACKILLESLKGGDHSDVSCNSRSEDNIQMNRRKIILAWSGFIWLSIGTVDGLL